MIVVPGYEYVVTTTSSCTVTDDATGTELVSAYAGQQAVFQAIGESITLSDPEAIVKVRRSPFESTPGGALSLAGGSELPAGYTLLTFLESDGAATMQLPFESKNKTFVCEHTLGMPKATSGIYVYGGHKVSKGYGIMYRAAHQGFMFLSDSDFIASGKFLRGEKYKIQWEVARNEEGKFIFSLAHEGETLSQTQQSFNQNWENVYNAFSTTEYGAKIGGATYELTINIEGASVKYVPAIDRNGLPCLYGLETRTPYYNKGSGAFIAGVGAVAQLTALLKRLPATGGTLTLSLPAEANTPEVSDMMDAAAAEKGWTLPVYEYRPAATTTYSLRRVRQVVWCRVAENTGGSYVSCNGERFNIERCAAIFGPLGNDPTAYGYAPFDSVEQAAEEWGLQPYVYPEDAEPTID